MNNLEDEAEQIVCLKWLFEGAKLVQNDSEGPHISFRGVRITLTRFRSHVVWGTDYGHSNLRRRLEHFADAEITNFNRLAPRQEHILSLDVAMDHLSTVHVLEGHADLDEPLKDLFFGELLILLLLFLYVECQVANWEEQV